MKGKSYIAENREIALKVYCAEGGNVEGTLRTPEKKHDLKGKSYIAKNKEIAFKVYCAEGGNVEGTLRTLEKKHDLKLSKPTFYDWMQKYNFEERKLKVDLALQKTRDFQISFEEKMLNDLVKQKEKYETYFESQAIPDHQATYAYTGIMKTIIDIKRKLAVSDVLKKAEADKAMTKDEMIKMIKEDVYGLAGN